ncbi:agouti-signaling protein-like [Boleophthalmus pectinirostris]|uniref:agouti-signaling protein-like n=1 Tax=Boleophthalmus pectinirostris TaxID=150288 RepID=UPI00242BB179|nr:agouti-signaling protein-like [Boleophthalmus pectinirostris]
MSSSRPAQNQVRTLNAAQRQRPIFARRGQYERQRVQVPAKPHKFPVGPTVPKPAPKPSPSRCSQLTQSCLPQDGCCDLWASCHCHFFNAICFCRRTTPLHALGQYGQT